MAPVHVLEMPRLKSRVALQLQHVPLCDDIILVSNRARMDFETRFLDQVIPLRDHTQCYDTMHVWYHSCTAGLLWQRSVCGPQSSGWIHPKSAAL